MLSKFRISPRRRKIISLVDDAPKANIRINKKLTSCFRNGVVFIGDLIDCKRSSQPRIRSRRASLKFRFPLQLPSASHKRPLKDSLLDQITGSYRQTCNKAMERDRGPTVISRRKEELRVLLDSLSSDTCKTWNLRHVRCSMNSSPLSFSTSTEGDYYF